MNCEIIYCYFHEFFVEIQLQKENFGHLGIWAPTQVYWPPKHPESITEDSDPSDFDKYESDVNNDAAFGEMDDEDDDENVDLSEIHISNFAIAKYANSCSIKYCIGECISKDSDTELTFIFIKRLSGFSDTDKM